jgi:transcriptional regulator with XRE-family HTH domain
MTSKGMPHPVCWAVGQRIKLAREAKGWLQADLADRAGYDTTAISLWERGKHSIGIVKLADVAQALDVSVSYLTMDI